jgi:hypothetical protein
VPPDGNSQQGGEALHFDCKGQTEGNWPFTADVQYANYRLDPWIDLFSRRAVNAAVVATGSFAANGPLKDPARFEARGEANDLQVGFAGFKLNSDRPIAWRYSDPVLAIERFRLRGPSTDFEVLTSVNSHPADVLFTAQGHADARSS